MIDVIVDDGFEKTIAVKVSLLALSLSDMLKLLLLGLLGQSHSMRRQTFLSRQKIKFHSKSSCKSIFSVECCDLVSSRL